MKLIKIEVSDDAAQFLQRRIDTGEYRDVGEYIAALVSNDCGDAMPDLLRQRLNEGIRSLDEGRGIKVTEESWQKKKDDFIARSGHRGEVA